MEAYRLDELRLLIARLERLSADSYWAHRASGLRGSLLRWLERVESEPAQDAAVAAHLEHLVGRGFDLLNKAAREIPEPRRY